MLVDVEISNDLMDKINSVAEGHERTVGEIIVKIIKEKFERDKMDNKIYGVATMFGD